MGVEFIYPEFEVLRSENRCIACRVCERQCANEVHYYDAERGIMMTDRTEVKHTTLIGSPLHLKRLLMNILSNAIKYTPAGSHISLSAVRAGPFVQVEVSDDGPGIADSAKQKIFDMFYTADNSRGDGRRGLGLGLSLCRSIITAHGGEISVQDHQPHGSVFRFTLRASEVKMYE